MRGERPATFSIETDRDHGIVRIRMDGFFTPEDVRKFLEARRIAHAELKCAPNAHLTLNDIRGLTGQSQTTVDAFEEVLDDPAARSRRLAFVVGPTLVRGQLLRALAGRDARVFDNPSDAEKWLLSDAADSAHCPVGRVGGAEVADAPREREPSGMKRPAAG